MLPGHMVTRVFVLLTPVFLLACRVRHHPGAAGRRHARRRYAVPRPRPHVHDGVRGSIRCHRGLPPRPLWRPDASASREPPSQLVQQALHRHPAWSGRGVRRRLPDVMAIRARHSGPASRGAQHAARRLEPRSPPTTRLLLKLWMLLARVGTAVKHLVISSALFVAGFAALWLPVFLLELHGDFRSYYRHFFGFFLGASGWGTFAGAAFHIVPSELLKAQARQYSVFRRADPVGPLSPSQGTRRAHRLAGDAVGQLVRRRLRILQESGRGRAALLLRIFRAGVDLHLACLQPETPVGGPGSARARLCGRPDAAAPRSSSRSESCSPKRARKRGRFGNTWPT